MLTQDATDLSALPCVLIAVWAFVEWRAQPPAPPNGKVLPWEQAAVKVGQ